MVTQTAVDKVNAESGFTIYIYNVTITDLDTASHSTNMLYFTLIGSSNVVYDVYYDPAIRQPLPAVDISHGQHVAGQVAFQVPNSDEPSKLECKTPYEAIDIVVENLPQPSLWVSEVSSSGKATVGGIGANIFYASYSLQNNSYWYYSTDRIAINVTMSAYPDLSASLQVSSITISTQGFNIVSVNPTLPHPVQVNGNGGSFSFILVLTLPQASVNVQPLEFTIVTS